MSNLKAKNASTGILTGFTAISCLLLVACTPYPATGIPMTTEAETAVITTAPVTEASSVSPASAGGVDLPARLATSAEEVKVLIFGTEPETEIETAAEDLEPTEAETKAADVVALEVADGLWGNGDERRQALLDAGYDPDIIQAMVNEIAPPEIEMYVPEGDAEDIYYYNPGRDHLNAYDGVFWFGEQKETWYNLPMDGVIRIARKHGIEGEYWVREDGCKMLGDYIMLATNNEVYPIGTLVMTSLGMGISLDTGTFAESNPLQIDVAVSWVKGQ